VRSKRGKNPPYLVGISTQLNGVAKVSKGLVPPPFWISVAKIRRKQGRRKGK
jgi:hypothetical protein